MTLIHSEITSDWALQVSDRLLTISSRDEVIDFDEHTNKTIVFHATDGIATLSYTGLGFVERAPTDAWIANQLNGDEYPFDPRNVDFAIRFGIRRTRWPQLGFALRLLAKKLSDAAALDHRLRKTPITIAVAGWQWYRKKVPRAFLAVISFDPKRGKYVAEWAPRQYGHFFLHLTAPKGYINRHESQEIDKRLSQLGLDGSTAVLVSSIRQVAERERTVGADCMAVSISHPWSPGRQIRAEMMINAGEVISRRQTTPMFASYSPWVIGPQECLPPTVMIGGGSISVQVGHFEYVRAGPAAPEPPPEGITLLLDAHRRKLK